ncbi:hypothetical protein RB195_003870 [Necator americanus]|uniref:Uncharacterized protein n=1 Tax=Necator americanus TaxID=51031 RepID=A0ABR1DQL3_NECAM
MRLRVLCSQSSIQIEPLSRQPSTLPLAAAVIRIAAHDSLHGSSGFNNPAASSQIAVTGNAAAALRKVHLFKWGVRMIYRHLPTHQTQKLRKDIMIVLDEGYVDRNL